LLSVKTKNLKIKFIVKKKKNFKIT